MLAALAASPAVCMYTLTIYVLPNCGGIHPVSPVFQVLFAVAVLSSVHSTTLAPVYTCTMLLVLLGFTPGILPDCCQTLSPRISSGLGIASLGASLLALV